MKKNILFALLANAFNAAISWILLLFLIRYGKKEDIGLYSLVQAIALPIHLFFTFKLRTIQLSDINNTFQKPEYFNSRILLSFASLFVTLAIASLMYMGNYKYILAISMLGVGYSAMLIREYFISIYQINEKNEYFFLSNIMFGLISTLTFIISYIAFKDIIVAIACFSISRVICLLVDIIILNKIFNERVITYLSIFNKTKTYSLLKLGLPLGITAVIGSLLTSIPRIKLEATSGLAVLGVFTTLMSLVAFFNLFMSSFSQALIPRLSQSYTLSKPQFKKELGQWSIFLSFILIIILILTYSFDTLILGTIFGREYTNYTDEFFLSMVAGCVLCIFHFTNMMLNVQRNFKPQVYIYSICAVICFISAYILIPYYDLKGAIYTALIASLSGILASITVFYIKFKRSN